jgi:hypothetical protein
MDMKDWKEIVKYSIDANTDWTMTVNGNDFEFSTTSPAGMDFIFELHDVETFNDLLDKSNEYLNSYDPSYEAYLWLGNDGHGKNGAPSDMGDLYEDMVSIQEYIEDLVGFLEDDLDLYEYETGIFQVEVWKKYKRTFYVKADSYDEAECKTNELIEMGEIDVSQNNSFADFNYYVEAKMSVEYAEENNIEYFE